MKRQRDEGSVVFVGVLAKPVGLQIILSGDQILIQKFDTGKELMEVGVHFFFGSFGSFDNALLVLENLDDQVFGREETVCPIKKSVPKAGVFG